jgi:hypothetical protein
VNCSQQCFLFYPLHFSQTFGLPLEKVKFALDTKKKKKKNCILINSFNFLLNEYIMLVSCHIKERRKEKKRERGGGGGGGVVKYM